MLPKTATPFAMLSVHAVGVPEAWVGGTAAKPFCVGGVLVSFELPHHGASDPFPLRCQAGPGIETSGHRLGSS